MANGRHLFNHILCTIAISSSLYTLYLLYQNKKKHCLPKASENGLTDLIGNTPLVKIKSLSKLTGCEIYAKLELMNIGGSSKDRVALALIRHAEKEGLLRPGKKDVIFEGTSGSTGISLTNIGLALGYKVHIVLPDDTSPEKVSLLESLGAIVEKVSPASIVDPNQFVNIAEKRSKELTDDFTIDSLGFFANQFENDNNWRVHYNQTGPEILQQMSNRLDIFVAGSGTGGTITGIAKFLSEKSPSTSICLADPQGSGFYNRINHGVLYDNVEKEGTRRRHQTDTLVEGIGLNRITHNFILGESLIDFAYKVTDKQALMMAKFLTVNDGFFWGSASAVAAVGCVKAALENPGSRIVMIATDTGARHLSKFWKAASQISSNITIEDILNCKD